MKKRWTLLFSVLLGIFSCVSVYRASAQQVEELNGAVGESVIFSTRVPVAGIIMYEGKTIGLVVNNQTVINEKFNRLSWSSEFFTLSDLTSDDSGLYTVESTKEVETRQSYQLNVYDKVSTPRVTNVSRNSSESDLCLLQCSVRNVRGLNLTWFRGNILLNKTSSSNISSINTTLNLPLEIQQIDKDIFSCEASNPVSKQNITVNFTKLCPHKLDKITDEKRSYVITAALISVVFILAVICMIIFIQRRKHKASLRSQDSSAIDEGLQEEVQYSEINHTAKKRNQGNIRESAAQETSLLTTIYDRIRPHQTETSE